MQCSGWSWFSTLFRDYSTAHQRHMVGGQCALIVWTGCVYVMLANVMQGTSLSPSAAALMRLRSLVGDYIFAVAVDGLFMPANMTCLG
jgi:hypothetical protein